ncbi:MAG: LptF/LptG family permease [Candidatus Omnitrophica bacterium]|nr:LptF/LptG family permease [Candidatus Omnitrophota bacterium]
MRIIDRYVTKSIILIFISTIFIFSMMVVLIDSAVNLDEFIDRKVPVEILVQYYLAYIPTVLVQTSSLGCLIAVLFTFTNLNSQNEVIVLRSAGMNFWQITKPALCFGLLISCAIFLVNEKYIPLAESRIRAIKNENMILEVDRKKKKQSKIKNLTFYGLKNRLYFIDSFDPNSFDIEGITIIEYDKQQNIKEKTHAFKGSWTGLAWKAFQCQVTNYAESDINKTRIKVYQQKLLDIEETPEDFLRQRINITSMNIRQLRKYISRFKDSGATRAINNLKVDLHQKIAFPFGNMVIILVGLPMALVTRSRRAGTLISLAIAIGIGFFYYLSNSVGLALGKGGLFPPILSAWLAPLLFTSVALYFIHEKF